MIKEACASSYILSAVSVAQLFMALFLPITSDLTVCPSLWQTLATSISSSISLSLYIYFYKLVLRAVRRRAAAAGRSRGPALLACSACLAAAWRSRVPCCGTFDALRMTVFEDLENH